MYPKVPYAFIVADAANAVVAEAANKAVTINPVAIFLPIFLIIISPIVYYCSSLYTLISVKYFHERSFLRLKR